MTTWPTVVLGEALVSPKRTRYRPRPRLPRGHDQALGRGVVSRGKVRGSEVVSVRNVVRAGQLILSKIDARNGAIGLVPRELDGAIVSNDFPSFEVRDASRCDIGFLGWLARSAQFVELCNAASEGSTNRVRISEERFLDQEILLPPLVEQRALVTQLDALAAKTREVDEHLDAVERDCLRCC